MAEGDERGLYAARGAAGDVHEVPRTSFKRLKTEWGLSLGFCTYQPAEGGNRYVRTSHFCWRLPTKARRGC